MSEAASPRVAPRLVSLEGGEGAGKSTVLAALRSELERGARVTCTREPGGTPVGEAIRGILLDTASPGPCDLAELLLMFASRAQLVREVIDPALARGDWVITDRFTDASHAYQGRGRGCDAALIERLEHDVVGLRPGLTLLLDVPVGIGLARARGRGGMDRIEAEQDAFFERVRAAYLDRARAEPERFVVIDASQPAEAVSAAAVEALCRYRSALA